MIVVIDASTVVSAALKPTSIPERALMRAFASDNSVFVSQAVLREYDEVLLRSKFDRYLSSDRRARILGLMRTGARRAEPDERVAACADPKDDKYLELAAACRAGVIVSGDVRHLLPMDGWRGVRIMRPADFLAAMPNNPGRLASL